MIKIFFSSSNTVFSRIVCFLNKSKFSHTGFIDYENGIVLDSDFLNKGVTIYPIDKLLKENDVTIIDDFHVSRETFNIALREIEKPYDLKGVSFFPINRNWQDVDKWYCSELVAYALFKSGYTIFQENTYRVSPQDLWNTINKIRKNNA